MENSNISNDDEDDDDDDDDSALSTYRYNQKR